MTAADAHHLAVLEAVRSIAPILRENARSAEKAGWIPDENVELLEKAGVFGIAVPERFGGTDLPAAQQLPVLEEVAKACGSTGWVTAVWVTTAWMASLYPDKAQEEIFAGGRVRVSGGFTPSGTLVPTEGGYLLTGEWRFNSGVRAADWNVCSALVEHGDGRVEDLYPLVPTSDLVIGDDWDVFGAAGTGSVTSTADGVFVPAHRVVGAEAYDAATRGRWNEDLRSRNYHLLSYVLTQCTAVYTGLARAALDVFVEKLPGKGIAYSNWTEQIKHPHIHHQVAVAANKIAAAEGLQRSLLELVQERADQGRRLTVAEKATIRGHIAYIVQTSKEAVDTLYTLSPASVIVRSGDLQRIERDILALSVHGLFAPLASLEVQGRLLLGLEPDNDYL
ncbi:acyl-CoA dehydrogenase [Streptomyces griseoloalbus]|uniref:acyl-CoA dehydrogenase family protein n=1 Tax=Streptomyces griseoloalbus TaxID=67303 RepID=UPI0018774D15|nr:acyl-CoA dehydrogenase [Streptomyces griseoloalbus]